MKKALLLLASLLLTSVSYAETIGTIVYGSQTDNATGVITDVMLYDLKTSVDKYIDVDFLVIDKTATGTNLVTNRYEPGVTLTYPIMDNLKVYIRPSIGYKQKSGTDPFYYYTSEQGLKFDLPYNFTTGIAYYYRQSFNDADHDRLDEMRYSIGYKLTDYDKVSVGRFIDFSGYNPASTWWLGYNHSF
jgi:hypothetical protein